MGILGFSFKVLGAVVGALACIVLGLGIQNGEGEDVWYGAAMMLVFAWGLAAAGASWHKRVPLLDSDVAERAGTRRFRPAKQRGWLPHEAWLDFPDPLPYTPDIIGDPAVDIPEGEVPPDENLRRLWLVRAKLAVHLDKREVRARARFRRGPTIALSAAGIAGGLVLALSGVDPETGENRTLAGLLVAAFLLWPFGRSLITHMEGLSLVARRENALRQEETRLMASDATRPAGPLGGDPVQPGTPYTPPRLSMYRGE
ncbi:hypothetical protein [Actinocrispum sp. NPDC049592]|uniref:hypothetical protein n=1 Tax=Actinocrispum sp. NPDC049592 TaxID=3154835 RepID=UPI003444FCAA